MADNLENDSDSDPSDNGSEKSPSKTDAEDFRAIESAVNEAAKRLNAVWVTFILLMAYIFIATGKITHKDLFLETPVKLPVLGVDVPLLGYFIAAPVFILAMHFYLLVQLRGLAAKFGEYNAVLLALPETAPGHVERLRHRIDNSLFAQAIAGHPDVTRSVLRVVAVLTGAMLPILLLLAIQLWFLPYQNSDVTNIHRAAILADVVLLAGFGLERMARAWHRPFANIRSAAWYRRGRTILGASVCAVALGSLWASWFVAILPSESYYFPTFTRAWFEADADPVHQGPSSWFSNRLVLPDQNLIEGFDLDKVKITRSLRGRHFVGAIFDRADLRQADFTAADLRFASLRGARLTKARLGCAYSDSGNSLCTRLQEALFVGADLRDASLLGANMMGASLDWANLTGASLFAASLEGASLNFTGLAAATLSGAVMDGASLSNANLIGTALSGTFVRGADFTNASLIGAVLYGVRAHDASFKSAQIQGASLQFATFVGAKFVKTSIYGADVSDSRFDSAAIGEPITGRLWRITIRDVEFGYDHGNLYTRDLHNDPFGKEGDVVDQMWNLEPFAPDEPVEIPTAEEDRLRALFPNGLPPDPLGKEIKERLARLGPHTATADWSKLPGVIVIENEHYKYLDEYKKRLGERLIIIACAKEGEGHVARGLMRSKRLCPYKEKIEEVLATAKMPDGRFCGDRQNLEQIWSEMYGKSCPPADGQR